MYCMVCPARMKNNTEHNMRPAVNITYVNHIFMLKNILKTRFMPSLWIIGLVLLLMLSNILISIKCCIAILHTAKPVKLQQHYQFSGGNCNYKKACKILCFETSWDGFWNKISSIAACLHTVYFLCQLQILCLKHCFLLGEFIFIKCYYFHKCIILQYLVKII